MYVFKITKETGRGKNYSRDFLSTHATKEEAVEELDKIEKDEKARYKVMKWWRS